MSDEEELDAQRERLRHHYEWRPTHPEAECELGGCDECFYGTPLFGPSTVRDIIARLDAAESREASLLAERDALREALGRVCGHHRQRLDAESGLLICENCGLAEPDPFHHNPGGGS